MKSRDIRRYHPTKAYAEAMKEHDFEVRAFLGGGSEALAFELASGTVLKLTGRHVRSDMGTRLFDLPILRRETLRLDGGFEMTYFEQPRVKTPVTMQQFRQFERALPQNYVFTDCKPENLGEHDGEIKLIDYWAVRRTD